MPSPKGPSIAQVRQANSPSGVLTRTVLRSACRRLGKAECLPSKGPSDGQVPRAATAWLVPSGHTPRPSRRARACTQLTIRGRSWSCTWKARSSVGDRLESDPIRSSRARQPSACRTPRCRRQCVRLRSEVRPLRPCAAKPVLRRASWPPPRRPLVVRLPWLKCHAALSL